MSRSGLIKSKQRQYICFVCSYKCELSNDLQNHLQRHRKIDLISSVIRLPDKEKCDLNVSTLGVTPERRCREQKEAGWDDMNNNCKQSGVEMPELKPKPKQNPRRSCRLRGIQRVQAALEDDEASNAEDNYYMPYELQCKQIKRECLSDSEMESTDSPILQRSKRCFQTDEDEKKKPTKKFKVKRKSESSKNTSIKIKEEPVFTTPTTARAPSSETDSCSGTVVSEESRIYCSYCGSGYRDEEQLAEHMRQNHFNCCKLCCANFPNLRRFFETLHAEMKVFICIYCNNEFNDRGLLITHQQQHLDSAIIDGVLALKEDYYTEGTQMNTMYNMFNAGYLHGRRTVLQAFDSNSVITEFYKVFLQYTRNDFNNVENYGHLCRTCGFTLFDPNQYKDHMQIVHGIGTHDIERLLSI